MLNTTIFSGQEMRVLVLAWIAVAIFGVVATIYVLPLIH